MHVADVPSSVPTDVPLAGLLNVRISDANVTRRTGRATDVTLTGIGFCLAFGWVWCAGEAFALYAALPDIFSGNLLSGGGVSIFFACLGAGCAGGGLFASGRNSRRMAVAAHVAALACVVAAWCGRGFAPQASAAPLGLAAACLGLCWGERLLRLTPAQAGAALAVAFLAACVPAVSIVCAGADALALLVLGVVLAGGLALMRDRRPGAASGGSAFGMAASAEGAEQVRPRNGMTAMYLLPTFFVLGVVTAAVPANGSVDVAGSALRIQTAGAGGAILAVVCCVCLRNVALVAPFLAGAAAWAAALYLACFPSGMIWHIAAADGFVGGIALAGFVAALRAEFSDSAGEEGALFRRAGFALFWVLVAVNAGGTAGALLVRSGDCGPQLFVLASVGMCPLLAPMGRMLRDKARAAHTACTLPSSETASEAPRNASGTVPTSEVSVWTSFTARERAVAELVAEGVSNPEICTRLNVSENTVRTHIKSLYRKTEAENRKALEDLLRRGC